jgi:uncharacterized protein
MEEDMLQPTVPAWFEIPVRDLDRATAFWESVLGARLTRETMGPLEMAVFPHEKPNATGALTRGDGFTPSAEGTVVYLHLDDIRPVLERVPAAGGRVALPRTELPGGMGFFAHVADTEGNRVGLFSGR